MREQFIEVGQTPPEESCVQPGTPNYDRNAMRECMAYIEALRKVVGPEPEGVRLSVKPLRHGKGHFFTVVCHYDEGRPDAHQAAQRYETKGPKTWAEAGIEPPVVVLPMQARAL